MNRLISRFLDDLDRRDEERRAEKASRRENPTSTEIYEEVIERLGPQFDDERVEEVGCQEMVEPGARRG